MKKVILLLLLFSIQIANSQINYHRLETYSSEEKACSENSSDRFVVKVNIHNENLLSIGQFYYLDLGDNFGLGKRYCKVVNNSVGAGDADFDLYEVPSYGINSYAICNTKFFYFNVSTYSSYQKYCENNLSDRFNLKINIKMTDALYNTLYEGSVMKIDFGGEFNLGERYCVINNKDGNKGDSDVDLHYIEDKIQFYVTGKCYNYHNIVTFTDKQKAENFLCNNSKLNDGSFKVNLLTNDLLLKDKIYKADFGSNFNLGNRYFVVSNAYLGRGDADFEIDTTITNEGNCSSSNPGGTPDLVLNINQSTTIVNNSGQATQSLATNVVDYIYIGDELQVYLQVDNSGNTGSSSSKVGFYLSTDNKINNAVEFKEVSLPGVSSSSYQTMSVALTHGDFANVAGVIGTAYLHIKIDNDNEINEGTAGESNNVFSSRKVEIKNVSRRPTIKSEFIQIKDISGKVLEEGSFNNGEESNVFEMLPGNKVLILNKDGKRTKIYKEN